MGARLDVLVGKQSADQIVALAETSGTTVLIDAETGDLLSAVDDLRARALAWISSGCGASSKVLSACVMSTGAELGSLFAREALPEARSASCEQLGNLGKDE